MTQTHAERLRSVTKNIDSHGIYPVAEMQKLLDDAGFSIKLHKGWKVTKSFLKSVTDSGGWCNMAVGTPIVDGRGVISYLMKHFKMTNPESFIGTGKQYYSDLALLVAEMQRLDALEGREPEAHAN